MMTALSLSLMDPSREKKKKPPGAFIRPPLRTFLMFIQTQKTDWLHSIIIPKL